MFEEDKISDSFEVVYSGPSFEGVMRIDSVVTELEGWNTCLRKVYHSLKRHNRIESDVQDFEIYVVPFEIGSFKKKLKFCSKEIEKHSVKVMIIIAVIGGLYTWFKDNAGQKLDAQQISNISDLVKVELLNDPTFVEGMKKIANPLTDLTDKLTFGYEKEKYQVDLSHKSNICTFLEEKNVEITEEVNVKKTVIGKVVMMDLDATKNQLGFKVIGEGREIPSTFSKDLDVSDYKELLGEWVKIQGIAQMHGKSYLHFFIEKIERTEPPISELTQTNID